MAATAHSDPYGVFLRKIGYSVGLERTLERFGDLQDPDFAVRGGEGWYASIGFRFTERLTDSVVDFWRERF